LILLLCDELLSFRRTPTGGASAGVRVPKWPIVHVAVTVERLRICRGGHQHVRLDEAAYLRIVIPCVEVVEACLLIEHLSSEAMRHREGRRRRVVVLAAERSVNHSIHFVTVAVG